MAADNDFLSTLTEEQREQYERDVRDDSAYYEKDEARDETLDEGFSSWQDFNDYMYG